jgi:hypothetical protein
MPCGAATACGNTLAAPGNITMAGAAAGALLLLPCASHIIIAVIPIWACLTPAVLCLAQTVTWPLIWLVNIHCLLFTAWLPVRQIRIVMLVAGMLQCRTLPMHVPV